MMASKYIIMNRIYFLIFMGLISCHSPKTDKSESISEVEEVENQSIHTYAMNANVRVGKIEEKSIEPKIYATGRIDVPPKDLISIHSRTKGFIQQLFVLPGDHVGKGKILAFYVKSPGAYFLVNYMVENHYGPVSMLRFYPGVI